MVELVQISSHSRAVIIHLHEKLTKKVACGELRQPLDSDLFVWLQQTKKKTAFDCTELLDWLSERLLVDKGERFLLESLRTELLKDLRHSFPNIGPRSVEKEPEPHETLFKFLTFVGTTVAMCDGFDGIASLFGLFPNVSSLVILGVGIIFAAFSVIVFRGFDLVAISKNLDVEIQGSRQLIDVLLEQINEIEKLKVLIFQSISKKSDKNLRKVFKKMAGMLIIRFDVLDEARADYARQLKAPFLMITKAVTAAIAGILFFSSGFFSGQTLALVVASLFSTSASIVFWPVLITSLTVGIAALGIYYYVQSPGLKNLVGSFFKVDEDKINAFAGVDRVLEQRKDLVLLQVGIDHVDELHQQITGLRRLNQVNCQESVGKGLPTHIDSGGMRLGRSQHFFHQRSRSLDERSCYYFTKPGMPSSDSQDPFDERDGDLSLCNQ